jgi:hypothetical protein
MRTRIQSLSLLARGRETQLAVGLPRHNLCNRMPYRHARLLDLLFRKASGYADFESGRELPPLVLSVSVGRDWHTFEPRNEYAVCECL